MAIKNPVSYDFYLRSLIELTFSIADYPVWLWSMNKWRGTDTITDNIYRGWRTFFLVSFTSLHIHQSLLNILRLPDKQPKYFLCKILIIFSLLYPMGRQKNQKTSHLVRTVSYQRDHGSLEYPWHKIWLKERKVIQYDQFLIVIIF